jgi:hypothetical protein
MISRLTGRLIKINNRTILELVYKDLNSLYVFMNHMNNNKEEYSTVQIKEKTKKFKFVFNTLNSKGIIASF